MGFIKHREAGKSARFKGLPAPVPVYINVEIEDDEGRRRDLPDG